MADPIAATALAVVRSAGNADVVHTIGIGCLAFHAGATAGTTQGAFETGDQSDDVLTVDARWIGVGVGETAAVGTGGRVALGTDAEIAGAIAAIDAGGTCRSAAADRLAVIGDAFPGVAASVRAGDLVTAVAATDDAGLA